jgi:hypothetical protein
MIIGSRVGKSLDHPLLPCRTLILFPLHLTLLTDDASLPHLLGASDNEAFSDDDEPCASPFIRSAS